MGGFLLASVFERLLQLTGSSVRSVLQSVHDRRSSEWPTAEAEVTADPERFDRFSGTTVEVVYSYRVAGELYTGLHEEPCFGSASEYMARFAKERRFVVRVKPSQPEVSLVRDEDQADGLYKRLEQIDELHKRQTERN